MPKMTHPNQERPLSVLDVDVDARLAEGWELVDAPAPVKQTQAAKKTAEKTAVTRKSATAKKK